ncbi:MAG: hypothetical protein ABIF82_02965 [Planctomycetota bacterium]
MGRIADLIRNNLFWVAMVVAAGGMGAVYVFVTRDMAREAEGMRAGSSAELRKLEDLAKRGSIPKEAMTAAAQDEKTDLEVLHGQLLVMFAARSGIFDKDFDALTRGEDIEVAVHGWWKEYQRRAQLLLARAKERLGATETLFTIKPTPPVPEPVLDVIEKDEAVFWRLEYVIESFIEANPKDERLIDKIFEVRLGGEVKGRTWVRGTEVKIIVAMSYENLGKLIAALQNSTRPLLVRSFTAQQPGLVKVAEEKETKPTPLIHVMLNCEIVEFLPVVQQAKFTGAAFKDPAAVNGWVQEQEKELGGAFLALYERVPSLRERATAKLGTTLKKARAEAQDSYEKGLKEIEADGAAELAKKIEEAKTDGKISATKKDDIEKRHAALVALREQRALEEHYRALLDITARAGGFTLVYDFLRPVIPQKAYFVGLAAGQKEYLIIKSPGDAEQGGGRWWLATAEGGKTYEKQKDVDARTTRDDIAAKIVDDDRSLRAVYVVGKKQADGPVLLMNGETGPLVQALIARPGGGWQTYPAVIVGKAVSLSDVAFRFAPVISAVGPKTFKKSGKLVIVVPDTALAKQGKRTFSIPVRTSTGGGAIEVTAGLRK